MKLSELIKQLQEIEKVEGGDIEAKRVEWDSWTLDIYYSPVEQVLVDSSNDNKFIAIE